MNQQDIEQVVKAVLLKMQSSDSSGGKALLFFP